MMENSSKDFLYKYVTAETAGKIFKNLTVRWRSPLTFNDPFDSQLNISYPSDTTYFESLKADIFRKLRKIEEPDKITKYSEEINNKVEKWIQSQRYELENSKRKWIWFVKGFRLFCLSEVYDNLLMWAHYTEDHKGAVIKFQNIPNGRLNLNKARKIIYSPNIPLVALSSMNFIAEIATGKKFDSDYLFFDNVLIKSNHWEYEKEWRCINIVDKEEKAVNEYEDKPILAEEINSVYLGCKMNTEVEKEIIALLRKELKHVAIFKATKNPKKFALDFTLMT